MGVRTRLRGDPYGVTASRRARAWAETLEGRVLLSTTDASDGSPGGPAFVGPVAVASVTTTGDLPINSLVSVGRATVTSVTPFDIGPLPNLFDGNNSTLVRSAGVNPAVIEVSFASPKTIRGFTLRFSHAPTYRWKVEAAATSVGGFTDVVSFTNAAGDVDSTRTLATPVTAQKLRLTAQRTSGDNYVHLDEWHIVGDVTYTRLSITPVSTTLAQFRTLRLKTTLFDSDGAATDVTGRATYSSDDEAVATVDPTGLLRAAGTGSTVVRAAFGGMGTNMTLSVVPPLQRDLNVTYIERTPRYDYDAAKNNPTPGDIVTFRGHIVNWDNVTPSADYRWEIDGQVVAGGTLSDLLPNEERVVTLPWAWQSSPHRVKLIVDPEAHVAEQSELNNSVEDRTDGLAVGFWVEQSLYDSFHVRQRALGIGSNSWEDWAQRQMTKWNEYNASAVWDGITPGGVTDRVRVDKITVVPDGSLPLNGGLAGNNPDSRDKTPDLVWGFPSSALDGTFYSNTTSKTLDNPFYLEPSLRHEMGHARYQVDEYTWDVANNNDVTQVQITDPTTGQAVAGSALMPYLAFDSVLYYNQGGGVMTGPWGNNVWSPHEAGALQRIAGRRAVAGNMNAPGNIGEYLNDIPANNHFRFVDGAGRPVAGAGVRWYAASPGPGYGGKIFDNTPEYVFSTDANGVATLPGAPFLPGSHKEAVVRVEAGGQIWYRFFEVSEMNLEYWRGHTLDANYTIELPLPNSPPEMDVAGLGTVSIADGDATPSLSDGTDFGPADVYATGPGLGLDDPKGYVIRTFAVKNRGGQPLRLTGAPAVRLAGANASDFSVVYAPAGTVTSETLTVFQIKFDPRAAGTRTATVSVASNDLNENPYNFTISGTGVVAGASVPGVKFNDLDGDGTRDPDEPGLGGWTVYADLNNDGAFQSSTEPSAISSAADGTFTLDGLPTDRVSVVREVQHPGWRATYPAEGFYTFNPFIDAIQRPFDFGNTQKALVAGTVFDDRNRNGVVDTGEAGVAGQEVFVDLDHDDEVDPNEPATVTDATGTYAFSLDAGEYTIKLIPAAGWVVNEPNSRVRVVTLQSGDVTLGQDVGVERVLHNAVLFYNNSSFDGNNPAANAADDAARDVFKGPLAPGLGGPGSFYNVSSYTKGINGVMVDVGRLPAGPFGGLPLSAADFTFRVRDRSAASGWAAAPAPTAVAVRAGAGAGGTDRVSVTFADNAIRNTWLEVTMLANAHTGLAAPQVFYFGNLVGETGDSPSSLRVSALDLTGVKRALNSAAGIDSRFDLNRDGRVNAQDLAAVRGSIFHELEALAPPAATPGRRSNLNH